VGGNVRLRHYHVSDCAEMMQLFYDTVHTVNAADYQDAQLDAWAPADTDAAAWHERFLRDDTIIAEVGGVIAGFGTRKGRGEFDLLYVHKAHQRKGIAAKIANETESRARADGCTTVMVDASITAKPFFESRGYIVRQRQEVALRGQVLTNYRMIKYFTDQ